MRTIQIITIQTILMGTAQFAHAEEYRSGGESQDNLERGMPNEDENAWRRAYAGYMARRPTAGISFSDYVVHHLQRKKKIGAGLFGGGIGALVPGVSLLYLGITWQDDNWLDFIGAFYLLFGTVATGVGAGLAITGAIFLGKYGGQLRRFKEYHNRRRGIAFKGITPTVSKQGTGGLSAAFTF